VLEDQTIVTCLGGLDPKYANVVGFQQYSNFDELCVLAHKVEKKRNSNLSNVSFKALTLDPAFDKGSFNPPSKPMIPYNSTL